MFLRKTSKSVTGFISSIPGPSRFPAHNPWSIRSASTSTLPPPPRSTKPRPSTPFAPRTPARAVPPTTVATPIRQAAWPWRPSATSPAGFKDIERIIYARPFEGPLGNRVRMLWFLVPFWGLVVGFYLTTPVPPKRNAEGQEIIEPTKESLFSVLWDYSTAFMMFGTSLVCFGWLVSPSRFVTRLTQVRRQAIASTTPSLTPGTIPTSVTSAKSTVGTIGKPTETPGEREFIRFQHGGHLMCYGELEKGREVNMEDMKVNLIAGQVRSPYLSLRMKTDKKLSLDAVAYRLDFRDTAVVKASDEEVVLSLSRIETVFGKLE